MHDDLAEALQAENDRLREQVAYLERALGLDFLPPMEWRLTPNEARLIGALVTRPVLTKDAAMALLYRDLGKEEAGIRIVDVFICKARKKLQPFGIEIKTVWGVGYALEADAKVAIRSLAEAAE